MEYGLIFHGTRTGKYYCKNMKYRITRKMVPIKGRASSLLEIILYAQIRGLKYQKQNRMEEETELQT